MKSWHPCLSSFNPFLIVFYFLFRRLGKRSADAYAQEDVLFSEPHRVHRVHRVHPVVTKAYADPGYEQPAKYVQFKLNYSDISCLE